MSLATLFHFLCAQHVLDINISIIRSLRLFCWITTLVVLFLVWCVLEFLQHGYNSNTHRTKNNATNVVIQQNSRKLLMMDILLSETCWAHKKWNKIASDIKLVFYSSTITMMCSPINIRFTCRKSKCFTFMAQHWSDVPAMAVVVHSCVSYSMSTINTYPYFKYLINRSRPYNIITHRIMECFCGAYYLLTPQCRVLLEKLTGLQLVRKFPTFHGARRFITALTSVRHLSLSWASPIQSIYPHPTSWRSILILSTYLYLGTYSVSVHVNNEVATYSVSVHVTLWKNVWNIHQYNQDLTISL